MSASNTILILGGGMVGSTMALDLARDIAEGGAGEGRSAASHMIRLVDVDAAKLDRAAARVREQTGVEIESIRADLSDAKTITELAREADLALGALSSNLGFSMIEALIEAGTNAVDISFMPQNPMELNERAAEAGVCIVFDCGVAPGLSNLLSAYGAQQLDRCESIEIMVGGVPKNPSPPYFYKAAFSPADVIEEYTRPARYVAHGEVVVRDALSEPETVVFDGVGELEAFNTDGLRSMIDTLDIPDMKEKTLRWPGHRELMQSLRDGGFFSTEEIDVKGVRVRAIDSTSAILFPRWTYEEDEADLTVMRVRVDGMLNESATGLVWNLIDEYHAPTRTTSMSRTTAFPATIIARRILAGRIEARGIVAPELLAGVPGLVDELLEGLQQRGIVVKQSVEHFPVPTSAT